MTDVIVTGLPRSGATSVAALIDYLPNAVCLNRPPWHLDQAGKIRGALPYCKWLAGDFAWSRACLKRLEPLPDFRAADGAPLLDGLHDARRVTAESGEPATILFTRPNLQENFILGMKHLTLYTALLPTLVKFDHFKIIAVIRHPLDVIASWQTLPEFPIGRGRPNGIARLWPEALALAESEGDALIRMVQLYELHLERYHQLREQLHIVKYEDVLDDPMTVSRLFSVKTPSAAVKLIKNPRRIRKTSETEAIRGALRKYGVFAKEYYGDIHFPSPALSRERVARSAG